MGRKSWIFWSKVGDFRAWRLWKKKDKVKWPKINFIHTTFLPRPQMAVCRTVAYKVLKSLFESLHHIRPWILFPQALASTPKAPGSIWEAGERWWTGRGGKKRHVVFYSTPGFESTSLRLGPPQTIPTLTGGRERRDAALCWQSWQISTHSPFITQLYNKFRSVTHYFEKTAKHRGRLSFNTIYCSSK